MEQNVMASLQAAMEIYEERWVTAAELSKQVSMMTPDWIREYGWKLPRERLSVTDAEGRQRVSRWGYPLHQIQRMIKEGRFRA